jgi:hypothetical protein
MRTFKKQVYMKFYPDSWLNSPELKRLKGEVKGFYIDMICQLFYCFPYGYCSVLNAQKANKLEKSVNRRVNRVVNHEDNEQDNLWLNLTLNCNLAEQLRVVDNIEAELSKFLPYSQEEIVGYIRVLEENRVLSRSSNGILYQRRMVKDFKRSVDAYLNGIKGGNPKFKKKKSGKIEVDNSLTTSRAQKSVKGRGEPSRSLPTLINKGVGNRESIERENTTQDGQKDHQVGEFQLQELYAKSWKDLSSSVGDHPPPMIKGLTEEGFIVWKDFVDWVEEHKFRELWVAKPLFPVSFQELVFKKGFHKGMWLPVIEHMLGSGIGSQHNLAYRIPQFMKYQQQKAGASSGANMAVGDTDYSSQRKW